MEIQKTIFKIESESEIVDVFFSSFNDKIVYCLTDELNFIKYSIESNEILFNIVLKKEKIELDKRLTFKLSLCDRYVCIVNKYGRYGYVYDIENDLIIIQLDRKSYHTNQTIFPFSFIRKDNQTLLIHSTDWNNLDVTNVSSQELLTARVNKSETKYYLDYFYGELNISPDSRFIVSSGWIWGPGSSIKLIDLNNWLNENIHEPEANQTNGYFIMSYYWDRAICWAGNDDILFLYDPKEEDLDEDDLEELNMDIEKSYIVIFNVSKSEIVRKIEFNNYSKNDYFEGTSDCRLFYNKHIFFSSKKDGMKVIDLSSGKLLYQNPELNIDNYDMTSETFYTLKSDNHVELIKLKG